MRLPHRSALFAAALLGTIFVTAPRLVQAASFDLMTQNLYLGADLTPIFGAPDLASLQIAVGQVYQNVQATNFPERAKTIADQVLAKRPLVIGLQEAVTWRTGPYDGPGIPAPTVTYDFVASLTTELAARGLTYNVIAQVQNLDRELPAQVGSSFFDVRLTDRDVLLAAAGVTFANPQGANFTNTFIVPLPGLGINVPVPRGWTSVDMTVGGDSFRLVNTHLESFSASVNRQQAQELIAGPGATALPLVMIGDFNAGPGTLTYGDLIGAGLGDVWSIGGVGSGFTCCQAANLQNDPSSLASRIDLALFRGAFNVLGADIVGEALVDRTNTQPRLWMSDHAGVVARLSVPEPAMLLPLTIGLVTMTLLARRRRRRA